MNPRPPDFTRRRFLKTSALATAAFALPRFSLGQPGPAKNSRLNVACIGVAGRGWYEVSELLKMPDVKIVALCDVDRERADRAVAHSVEFRKTAELATDLTGVPIFSDYREMFAQMADQIDAVTVATPDHHHFPAAMMAIQRGKHVYVEKPLAHTVGEVRALRAAAKAKGIVSQMGNQGRATEGIRLIREWTQAGVLGEVREVHAWSPEFPERYFTRPKSMPLEAETPPPTLDWNVWNGPVEPSPYNHLLAPEKWRGFWKYGNGMLGDWACHTLDGPFWALDLGAPSSVEAEVSSVGELSPEWAEVTFRFPARGALPPVTMKWFEGTPKRPKAPAMWEDDPKKPGMPERGMLMLGDKHTLYAPIGRPDSPRLIPSAAMAAFTNRPPKTIPRVIGGPVKEWTDAIARGGPMPGSNFDYSARLSEMVLLGVVAVRTGKKIEWDARAGRITNEPALNELIKITAREGWKV